MRNIYCIYMVFSVQENGEKKEVYLLSSSPTEIKPPAIKIKSVKQLLNELRYHFKIMFASGEIAFIEECVYSSLLLQNENAVDFVAEKVEEFDIEEDLVVSYVTVFEKKQTSRNHYWSRIQFDHESDTYVSNENLNYLIDYAMEKL